MIPIDGSTGEGGGQILRSALALSMVTARPFCIQNIRANRSKPGLLRQHLTAVNAAAAICNAKISGAELGSDFVSFTPGSVQCGEYSFAIGSAGSTTLVLQTVLPALMVGDEPSTLIIEGGTHNMYAPTVDFLCSSFLPIVERMGPRVHVEIERHGFYPAGGGRIRVQIDPASLLTPVSIMKRGEVVEQMATATVAGLSPEIAKRELDVVAEKLQWDTDSLRLNQLNDSVGPGNVLSVRIQSEHVTEFFTGFGERGRSAERVAKSTVSQVQHYLHSGAPVWGHLADQLMLPFAMAGAGEFSTCTLTPHSETNASIIQQFLEVNIQVSEHDQGLQAVRIRG
ncbi:MAG: RNA 3'-terminal phosphate cyclase [Phycisphaerales bacterium]